MKSELDQGFIRGITAAVAYLSKIEKMDALAWRLTCETGYSIADFEFGGPEPEDMKEVKRIFRKEGGD